LQSKISSADRPEYVKPPKAPKSGHDLVINDDTHQTLAAATTVGAKLTGKTMSEKAAIIGAEVAGKAKKAKVKTVVFDRGGNRYHGRVKALADAARQEGLDF
jgi:large subunit ribosomal protein L18